MRRQHNLHIEKVVKAAAMLGDLSREVVFIGGAIVGLLITDQAIPGVRPTIDVDVVAEIASRLDYYRLEDRLRERGFRENSEEGVICRWWQKDIILDVMPTTPDILGFSNRWYADALRYSQTMELENVSLRSSRRPTF
ncbi:MAG: hypothetical protein PWQ57_2609 [Desulfovibrionales bacterium]|jgi:hypothetical protein|nr:hypothetical protein [Desulfovibrionales bacterium]